MLIISTKIKVADNRSYAKGKKGINILHLDIVLCGLHMYRKQS